ncbi:MAG TPA: Hsp20/alpha crystallin family protein [Saprospiraceae bacterium]|nr:Hsp20/alpha crystallin family protein [Saprospiraceae bacterium]
MNIMKYDPANGERNITNLFDSFFNRSLSDFWGSDLSITQPSVNIYEHADHFSIELAAPGLTKNDFKVEVDNEYLVISASKEKSNEENRGKYMRHEFNYQTFSRRFFLPETVDADKIEGKYENGILYLNVPKKEEAKTKSPFSVKIK